MTFDTQSGSLDSRDDFEDTPRGQYEYWNEEVVASQIARRDWHKEAARINTKFLDTRKSGDTADSGEGQAFRLNLFHTNITTLTSMIYGNLPKIDVSRTYADPDDDVSRVGAEMMERMLNLDIQEDGEKYDAVLRSCLQDRLLPGLGCGRVRYEVETEEKPVEPQLDQFGSPIAFEEGAEVETIVTFEDAPVDYFHWRDLLWGWARTWSEIPWISYKLYMSKDEVTEKWGDEIAEELTYKSQKVNDTNDTKDSAEDPEMADVWNKAEILEIWDKVSRKVIWMSQGYDKIIETKDDFLNLENFFPSPPFFIANVTTTLYTPTPDWHMAKDLYNEIDRLQTRISIITEAVKVVGVYDAECDQSVARMLKEGNENQLIPVKSWALFNEKGGLEGTIQWMPLGDIVAALDKLRDIRDNTIQLLNQITGMSEVMRGQGGQYEGNEQTKIKAKFSSVRIQSLQDEFAVFASGLMSLKAEVISKHFQPETIVKQSNVMMTADAEYAMPAVQLIKNYQDARLKVSIRPESVAMVDYAELKQERSEYIMAVAQFWQSAAPILKEDPEMKPMMLQMLQWGLAGFKGASEIEGVMDKGIAAAQKRIQEQQGQQKPDPKMAAINAQMQLEQMKQKGDMDRLKAKSQADGMAREHDMKADIMTSRAENESKLTEIEAGMHATMAETKAKLEADLLREQAQVQGNILQTQVTAQSEIEKDAAETSLEIEKESAKTSLKINEIAAAASAKIAEASAKPPQGKSDD